VFVTIGYFRPSLILTWKAGSYQIKTRGRLLALPTNIRLGRTGTKLKKYIFLSPTHLSRNWRRLKLNNRFSDHVCSPPFQFIPRDRRSQGHRQEEARYQSKTAGENRLEHLYLFFAGKAGELTEWRPLLLPTKLITPYLA
jgi:hypothetical protein